MEISLGVDREAKERTFVDLLLRRSERNGAHALSGDRPMKDLYYLALVFGFFALSWGFISLADRLSKASRS
jgi:hypothetical protein